MALGFNNGAPHVRIKTMTGTEFTSYRRGKKRASTHWASMTLILDAHRKRFTSVRDILGKSTLKKVYFDRGFYDGEHFDWPNKKHIQFVCRGKQRTKVADQVSEIPVEGYVEEILTYPKEYRPKTDREKGAKAERDALVDEYRNRWGVEVLFKEEKSYWHLNKLPSSI